MFTLRAFAAFLMPRRRFLFADAMIFSFRFIDFRRLSPADAFAFIYFDFSCFRQL